MFGVDPDPVYDHFSASVNITQILLFTVYFDSTGGATEVLSNYAAAVSETMQELAEFQLSEHI